MFKRNLRQVSHETRSMKYGPGTYAVFIKLSPKGDNRECLKPTY